MFRYDEDGVHKKLKIKRTSGVDNPATIFGASLGAWYDPSDSSTVTTATGVVSMTDKSLNGHVLVQPTSVNQPLYGNRDINGLNCLDFDGIDDVLFVPSTLYNLTNSDNLIFCVYFSDTSGDGTQRIINAQVGNSRHFLQRTPSQVSYANFLNFSAAGSADLARITNTTSPQLGIGMLSGKIQTIRNERGELGANGSGNRFTSVFFNIGGQSISANRFNGRMGEFGFVRSSATVGQINALGRYLSGKWGTGWVNY